MISPEALLFLNIGATEILLVLILFILLFGVDKVPEIARALGRAQRQLGRVKRQVEREFKTPAEKELDALRRFEETREAQVRQSTPAFRHEQQLREAARALGVEGADTMDVPRLKREIRARAGSGDGASDHEGNRGGGEGPAES